jgi:hypothetical protein
MADISEVADALAAVIETAAYPNGIGQPSVGECDVIIYQGWPDPETLEHDLAAGKVHISIFPRPGGRVTTTVMGDGEWFEVSNNGATGVSTVEVRRQTRTVQITVWANDPSLRSKVAKAVDAMLALTTRIPMPDGTQAMLGSASESQIDAQQKSSIYRRDLIYTLDFATTASRNDSAIRTPVLTITAGPTTDAAGPTITLPR